MTITNIRIATFVFIISSIFSSCAEEEPKIIPDVYVRFSINLSLPQFNSLTVQGNSIIYPNEGYDNNGVIIFRYTQDDFLAFDATCPQHITRSTAILLNDEETLGTAICPHCETTYSFFNFGQANKGYPLKRYQAILSGGYVHVNN